MKNSISNSSTTTTETNETYVMHQAPANWRADPSMLTWRDMAALETDDREAALAALGWVDAGDDTPQAVFESVNRWLARTHAVSPGRAADLISFAKLAFVFAQQHENADAKARA